MSETSEGSRSQSRLSALMPEIRQRLIELGAPLLLTETEGRLALAERKIAAFEHKYKSTLAPLNRDGLPDDASMAMHEDFVEWSGWQRTYEEAEPDSRRTTAPDGAILCCLCSRTLRVKFLYRGQGLNRQGAKSAKTGRFFLALLASSRFLVPCLVPARPG